jgi:hypothetical protein
LGDWEFQAVFFFSWRHLRRLYRAGNIAAKSDKQMVELINRRAALPRSARTDCADHVTALSPDIRPRARYINGASGTAPGRTL